MSAMIERAQNYWDRRPCNVRHGRSPVGSLEWSREVTARKYLVEPHIPDFAQFARWRDKRVLEMGCGIGTDTLEFLRAGAVMHAVDLSQQSLLLAWQRCRYERIGKFFEEKGRVSFHAANAEDWLPAGPFDLAYSFGVLHHTPRPDRVLEKIYYRLV